LVKLARKNRAHRLFSLGSARVPRAGFSLAPEQLSLDANPMGRSECMGKVRDREDAARVRYPEFAAVLSGVDEASNAQNVQDRYGT
jgi:hypothetical protein